MEPNQDVMVACVECTSKVSLGNTIYDKKGTSLICYECYNKLARGIQPEQYKTVQSSEPDKLIYNCRSCGFKFSRSKNFKFNGLCFNCGKESLQIEQTQEKLIRNRKTLL